MLWPGHTLLACLLACLLTLGCHNKTVRPKVLKELVVSREKSLLFTYSDRSQNFQTVQKLEQIPEYARGLVKVVDPEAGFGQPAGNDKVQVVDLRGLIEKESRPCHTM